MCSRSSTPCCERREASKLSAAKGGANTRQMVPAVPQRVVLDGELRGDRRAEAQREWGGAIQFVIREGPHCSSRFAAVPAQEFERCGFRYAVIKSDKAAIYGGLIITISGAKRDQVGPFDRPVLHFQYSIRHGQIRASFGASDMPLLACLNLLLKRWPTA
jgi:hypothetical protein